MSVKDCIAQQYGLHDLICKAITNLKKTGKKNYTSNILKIHLQNLEKKWATFCDNHNQLLIVREDNPTEPYFAQELFTKGEEKYIEAKVHIQDELDLLVPTVSNVVPPTTTAPVAQVRKMFPQLEIPKFSGDFLAWPAFKDMFASMVKDDAMLPPVQKLHYLKASLTGEPAQLLVNVGVTGDNFRRAWEILTERYDNKRALVNAYMGRFLSIQPVTKDNVSGLRSLLNDTNEVIGGLRTLGRPVDQWDDFLVYMTVSRLDRYSRRAWEERIGAQRNTPDFETLKTFLVSRVAALESLESEQGTQLKSTTTGGKEKMTGVKPVKKVISTQFHGVSVKDGNCPLCSGKHAVLFCPTFRSKDIEQRRELIRRYNLCYNCLGRHIIRECLSTKRCQTCAGRHHTMIHQPTTETPAREPVAPIGPSTSGLNANSSTFVPANSAVNSHLVQNPL